jgi:hypothetical protein
MIKRILYIYLAVLAIALVGCSKESPLSDVELTDPSIVRPDIKFIRMKDNNTLTTLIGAWIYDKNDNSIELKNGGVLINNKETVVRKLGAAPYYSGIEVFPEIQLGQTYIVEIKLNSNKSYYASIAIPDKDLSNLTIPSRQNKYENMKISWTDAVPSRPLKLTITYYYKKDNQELSNFTTLDIPPANLTTGEYTISAGVFQGYPNIYKTSIELRSVTYGSIYEGFLKGSMITYDMSVSKSCDVF